MQKGTAQQHNKTVSFLVKKTAITAISWKAEAAYGFQKFFLKISFYEVASSLSYLYILLHYEAVQLEINCIFFHYDLFSFRLVTFYKRKGLSFV